MELKINELKKELIFVILFFIIVWGSGLYMYLDGERVPNLSILICSFIGYNKVSATFKNNIKNSKANILNEWNYVLTLKLNSWKSWIINMKKFIVILAWNNIIFQNWKKTILNKNINNKTINLLENFDINYINGIISKKLYISIMYEILLKKIYNKYYIWKIIIKSNKILNIILNKNLSNSISLDYLILNLKKK